MTSAGYIHPGEEREDFFAGYSSPRNKTLMRVFKDLDMVEYLGSGMPRILKAYSRDAYIFSSRFIRTVFPKDQEALAMEKEEIAEGGAIGSVIGGAIELTNRQREILELIKSDSKISYRAIASTLGINESAVQKQLDTLKGKGVLKRVGGTRGHWEVLE
ncbi:MAG: winged helix-turn-helix transcriptional regulator [Desulfobulbaceae bacterium]|nr:winged helix-turn-helix transcriptional regulator [Desulfobulbaceae bacterium]